VKAFIDSLKVAGFEGDVDDSLVTREAFSHDASMFEIVPQLVVAPKHSQDVQAVVRQVAIAAKKHPHDDYSVTVRSAGTCMSGGAINTSIIIDMGRYFTKVLATSKTRVTTQPGVLYRNFEAETLKHGSIMPSFPASRDLCSIGGMVSNNSGGEKSLQYGKTERFVTQLSVVFADGNEYIVRPLNKVELAAKCQQTNFEGQVYRDIFELVDKYYDEIKAAKPNVSKDSTAYHLWNVWDRQTGIFDLTQIIVGAQGTLGIVTEVNFNLVKAPTHSGTLVVFVRDISDLGNLINTVMKHSPATFEGFDNYTLMLSFKLFFYFHQTLGWGGLFKLGFQLIPDALMLFRGVPKMVLLIEFNGETPEDVTRKVKAMHHDLLPFRHRVTFEEDDTAEKAKKFWIMRRESFNLLRKTVHDKHTAPFIDDLIVPPACLPEFLPELREILNRYKFLATVAGHMGDGNFHVIPLMRFEETLERIKLAPAMREVNALVVKYGGSLSGEHNDGMSRGPWLHQMYSKSMMAHFRRTKHVFDPQNIFNPHKKTDSSWEFSMSHMREHF